jgi:hypothetical protein
MLAMHRAISLLFIWRFLLLVSSFQPKVVAVERFSSPLSTVLVSLLQGKDAKDPTRPRLWCKPLFGEIQDMREGPSESMTSSSSNSSVPAVSRKISVFMAKALLSRGGGGSPVSPLSYFLIPFLYLRKLPAFVAQSKTRCAITLCISILGECISTSLNKYSKVHQSPRALLAAMGLYLMTYVKRNDAFVVHLLYRLNHLASFSSCFPRAA